MVVHTHKSHSSYLKHADTVFENIEVVPDFKTRVEPRGYTQAKYDEGKGFYEKAEDFYNEFIKKQRKRNGKKRRVNNLLKKIKKEYFNLLKRLRREFFDDPETKEELGLVGRRTGKGPRLIGEVSTFYDSCITDAELSAKLEAKGFPKSIFEKATAKIEEYSTAGKAYEQLKGECQSLVQKRDLAFRQLRAWMVAFQYAAEYVYADNLQELERLNIFERNVPKRTKKVEPTTTDTDTTSTDTNTTDTTGTTDTTSTTTAPETTTTPGTKEPTQSTQSTQSTESTQPTTPMEPTIETETGTNA